MPLDLLNWIAPHRIKIRRTIGKGQGGEVVLGVWDKTTKVAMKKLKNHGDMKAFAAEVTLLRRLNHPNIIRLLGITPGDCVFGEYEYYMVFEYAPKGNLLEYLRDPAHQGITIHEMLTMGIQIVFGMKYLHSKNIVHRDLAARNILIDQEVPKFKLKISDFGLSRNTSEEIDNIYYSKEPIPKIPFRWSAPETVTLDLKKSSKASDVWSFAIVLFEIFSYGELPYGAVDRSDLPSTIKAGKHPNKPTVCPPEVYALMESCWNFEEIERPTFEEILPMLERLDNSPNILK